MSVRAVLTNGRTAKEYGCRTRFLGPLVLVKVTKLAKRKFNCKGICYSWITGLENKRYFSVSE
jgi:hypothetical protein